MHAESRTTYSGSITFSSIIHVLSIIWKLQSDTCCYTIATIYMIIYGFLSTLPVLQCLDVYKVLATFPFCRLTDSENTTLDVLSSFVLSLSLFVSVRVMVAKKTKDKQQWNNNWGGYSRFQPDFLQSHSFSGHFVLGFVNHAISSLTYLLHLLKRIHWYLNKKTNKLVVGVCVSRLAASLCVANCSSHVTYDRLTVSSR